MSDVLETVGAFAVGFLALGIALLCLQIAGNIYGGIKGAYRLRAIMMRNGSGHLSHSGTIRYGLKAWGGQRYRNGFGSYVQIGGMEVPVDGRDPIGRSRYPA